MAHHLHGYVLGCWCMFAHGCWIVPLQVMQDAERNLRSLKLRPTDDTVQLNVGQHNMISLHNDHLEERKKPSGKDSTAQLLSRVAAAQRFSQLHPLRGQYE